MLCSEEESDTTPSRIGHVLCPFCGFDSTRVVDSRLTEPGDAVRRRRECAGCGNRFTTYERAENVALVVIKRDGRRENFDRQKLMGGLLRAAAKRPVKVPELEAVVDSIAAEVRRNGGELDSVRVGELALRGLASVDRVAGMLFAAVYRSIADLEEFEAELRRLESEPVPGADQLPLGAVDPSDPRASIDRPPAERSSGREGALEPLRRGHAAHP
jgi:transcriptional repressor NrdR